MNRGSCLNKTKFKRAVIISNGKVINKEFFMKMIKKSDYVIAANGGSKHTKSFGLIPNVIVGDLDSISKKDYLFFLNNGTHIKKHTPIKDKTDIHLALEHAMECGFKEILLLCVFGNRLDHMLANIFLLIMIVEADINVKIVDEFHEIILINKLGRIEGNIGDIVSLIPLTPTVCGVKLSGLKFAPKKGILKMTETLGISNVLTKKLAIITINKGKLLLIKTNSSRFQKF
jgi:thiamine pyrophosphokinase